MESNRWRLSIVLLFLALGSLTACQSRPITTREAGTLTGGAMGAGLGAIIGNQVGRTGEGIAIGAATGAISGALIGNEFSRQEQRSAEVQARIDRQERAIEENRRVIEELKRRGADVRETSRGIVVNLPDVLFEFDRADIKPEARRACSEIADVLKRYPDRLISVEGHTDSVGTIAYNQRLSEARARAVAEELASQGLARRRMSIRGYGETDPIASNRTEAGRARNRRVEVILEN